MAPAGVSMPADDHSDPPAEVLLEVLDVAEDALTLTSLAKIHSTLGHRDAARRAPTAAGISKWVEALAARGVVTSNGRVDLGEWFS